MILNRTRNLPGRDKALVVAGAYGLAGLLLVTDLPLPAAVILLGLAVVLASVSPAGATAAAIMAVPYVAHPVAFGGLHFSLLELAIVAAGAGLVVHGGIGALRGSERSATWLRPLSPWQLVVPAGLLLVAGFISLFTLVDPAHRPESLRTFRWTILEPLALMYLVRWSARRGQSPLLAGAVALSLVLPAVGAAVQLVTGGGITGDDVHRATWPYLHPNNLALFLERTAIFAIGLGVMLPPPRNRILLAVGALGVAGTLLTASRGGVLALVAGFAAIALLSRRRATRGVALVGGLAVVALFALVAGDRLLATGSGATVSSRQLIWRSSVDMIRDFPLTGIGLDQFLGQYGLRYIDPAGWPERYTSHPHNLVLDFWLSLGVPGLVVLLSFIPLVLLGVRVVRSPGKTGFSWGRALAAASLAALAAGFVHGLVDNGYFLADLAALSWVLLAFIGGAGVASEKVDAAIGGLATSEAGRGG